MLKKKRIFNYFLQNILRKLSAFQIIEIPMKRNPISLNYFKYVKNLSIYSANENEQNIETLMRAMDAILGTLIFDIYITCTYEGGKNATSKIRSQFNSPIVLREI